jgi:2-polyprenyl-6-methoxyphenol hydroxylase-like FAD-dependent oxidoreductase
MFDADVLIVGAGPVGLLSALALAQNGARVIVVEADSRLNDSPRAAVYFPSTLGALCELGVLDDLGKRGFRNSRLGYHVPGLDFHVMISLEVLHGITFDYMVHAGQGVIDEIAMAHAQPWARAFCSIIGSPRCARTRTASSGRLKHPVGSGKSAPSG